MNFVKLAAVSAALLVTSPALAEPFNGFYVGAGLGYDNFEMKADDFFTPGDSFDGVSGNGIAGSVFAGYDFAFGGAAFGGIEVGAELSGAKASYDDTIDALSVKAKESWLASARLGAKVNDSTGLYAKAGWINTKFKGTLNGFSDSDREDAIFYGAGLETGLGSNSSLRVEYMIRDYGSVGGIDVKNGQVQTGVSFRF